MLRRSHQFGKTIRSFLWCIEARRTAGPSPLWRSFSGGGSSSSSPPEPPLQTERTYDRLRGGSSTTRRGGAGKLSNTFSVDRTGLAAGGVGEGDELDYQIQDVLGIAGKESPSPLVKDLLTFIKLRGPISLHDFMAQASNHAIHGYYQNATVNKIGSKGDFVTAPEISQLFGEMIGVWCLSTWHSLGEPAAINLIELGPGRGTLMKDILRVAQRFPKFRNALQISLVELSETMRKVQQETLGLQIDDNPSSGDEPGGNRGGVVGAKTAQGTPVSWYFMLQQVPEQEGVPTLAIGQEFLDAFPVHQFVYTSKGWREKLVDVDSTADSPFFFRIVLSNSATPAIKALLMRESLLLRQPTAAATTADGTTRQSPIPDGLSENDGIEISPLALATCEDVAKRIHKTRGAALFLDYGENFTQGDSLRAFKRHAQINILSEPGVADITADVDFAACCTVASRKNVKAYGAIGQGEFLVSMGIVSRAEQLIEAESTSEDAAADIVQGVRKLIDPSEMGRRFKVIAFADKGLLEGSLAGFPPSQPQNG